MTTPRYWKGATRELAARDAVLKKLVTQFKGLALGSRGDAFQTLARAIVGQQISVKAAQSVWNRFSAELQTVTPATVHGADTQRLRACGLSGQKTGYLQDLAGQFRSGALDAGRWQQLDDETLIAELVQVKGKTKPVLVYQVLGSREMPSKTHRNWANETMPSC